MKKRKIISAAIVLGGLVLFVVIINLPSGSDGQRSLSAGEGTARLDSGLQFQVNQNRNAITNPTSTSGNSENTDNLTDQVAQGLSQNILQMNNGFDQGTSTIKLPSSDSLGNMIAGSAANQDLQFPVFSQKDIRVLSNNTPEAQQIYLTVIRTMTQRNFGGFKTPIIDILNTFFEKGDSAPLAKYVDIAGKEVSDLLALKVPQQLSPWHLQNLNLWEKKIIVYKAILNLNDDPLKAALAIQQVNGIGQENENIQGVLNDYVKKLTAGG